MTPDEMILLCLHPDVAPADVASIAPTIDDIINLTLPVPIGAAQVGDQLLNVRAGPGTEYAKVGLLPPATRLDIWRIISGWLCISTPDVAGWVAGAYVR